MPRPTTVLQELRQLQRPAELWRRLSLRRKLYGLALIALAPSGLLLVQLAAAGVLDLVHAQRRLEGLRVLQRAESFQGGIEAGLESCRAGKPAGDAALAADWKELRAGAGAHGGAAISDALDRLDGDWTTLSEADADLKEGALQALRDDLPRLCQRLAEASGLTQDESLARLGLARAAAVSLPALEAQLSRLRDTELAADRAGRVKAADLQALNLQQQLFSQQMAQALQDLDSAFADEEGLKARLIDDFGESPFGLFQVSADRYAAAVQEHFDAGGKDASLRSYCGVRYGQLLEARKALYLRLQELQLQRHRRAELWRAGLLAGAALLTALLFGLSLALARWGAEEVLARLGHLSAAARRVARDGDLGEALAVEGSDEIAALIADYNAMVDGLAGALRGLDESAAALRQAADALGQAAQEQQITVIRQGTALQQALVTSEEIRLSAEQAAQRAARVGDQALGAQAAALEGSAALADGESEMRSMASAIQGLRGQLASLPEQLARTEAVAEVVKELAVQSNVLALNAAIEALRAGESGKSFGLVAREMRGLADRSAAESQRVGEQLASLAALTREAARQAQGSGERLELGLGKLSEGLRSLQGLADAVQQGAEQASQIAGAVREQGVGLDQLLQALREQSVLMRKSESEANNVAALTQPLLATAAGMEAQASRWRRQTRS